MQTQGRTNRFLSRTVAALLGAWALLPGCGGEPETGAPLDTQQSALSGVVCPFTDPSLGVECPAGSTPNQSNTTLSCSQTIPGLVGPAICPGNNYQVNQTGVDTCSVCAPRPWPFSGQVCTPAVNAICPPGTTMNTNGSDTCSTTTTVMVPPAAFGSPPCPSTSGATCPTGYDAWWGGNRRLICQHLLPAEVIDASCPVLTSRRVVATGPDVCALVGLKGGVPPICPLGYTLSTSGRDSCSRPDTWLYAPPITL